MNFKIFTTEEHILWQSPLGRVTVVANQSLVPLNSIGHTGRAAHHKASMPTKIFGRILIKTFLLPKAEMTQQRYSPFVLVHILFLYF